jgi:hypothetical protein
LTTLIYSLSRTTNSKLGHNLAEDTRNKTLHDGATIILNQVKHDKKVADKYQPQGGFHMKHNQLQKWIEVVGQNAKSLIFFCCI